MRAEGTFEVELTPLESHAPAEAGIGRMSISKRLHGDLEGRGVGEMLSGGSPESGAAGYVALETITGRLGGREGSFQLQHSSTMGSGEQRQSIEVVPGSGRGELAGIEGRFVIVIEDGRHAYELDYSLPGEA